MVTAQPLPVPEVRPSRPELKLVVAYVAWRSAQSNRPVAEAEISRRYLAQLLRRSDPRSVSRTLRSLTKQDKGGIEWLRLTTSARGTRAHFFSLGDHPLIDRDGWGQCGAALFGDDGAFAGMLSRPAVKERTGLGVTGCLALGWVRSAGECSMGDLVAALSGFVTRPTVASRVTLLVKQGLLIESKGALRTPPDLELKLRYFEESNDLGSFARWQDEEMSLERQRRQQRIDGQSWVRTRKASLRSMRCVYCEALPVAGRGDVDHFPAKVFGGTDATSLLLPACSPCNIRFGRPLRGLHLERPNVAIDIVCPEPIHDEWIVDFMLDQHLFFVDEILSGNPASARQRVRQVWPIWLTHATKAGRSIDATTGELIPLGLDTSHELLLRRLDEHRGLVMAMIEAHESAPST